MDENTRGDNDNPTWQEPYERSGSNHPSRNPDRSGDPSGLPPRSEYPDRRLADDRSGRPGQNDYQGQPPWLSGQPPRDDRRPPRDRGTSSPRDQQRYRKDWQSSWEDWEQRRAGRDHLDPAVPPSYPVPQEGTHRGTTDDNREWGRDRHRTWDSWGGEQRGNFENQESIWTPAWQQNQSGGGQRADQPWFSERGKRPTGQKPNPGARGGRVAALGKRSAQFGKQASNAGVTGYQWAVKQRKRFLSTRRGRIITAVIVASLLLATLGSVGLAYAEYHHVKSQATVGLAHLKAAETDLKMLETNPFDTTAITQAQDELQQSNVAFVQMNDSIQHIPGVLGITPIVGSDVDAVLQIGPIAVEATQAGVLGCQILGILAPKLQKPLATNIKGLNSSDISTIDAEFNTLYGLASTILQQVQNLPPSAANLDPRLGSALSAVSTNLPEFQQGLQDAKGFMAVLSQLLGVDQRANYLLEVMDSTELRPGGGFIGNVGTLTLSGGRLQGKPEIKDVDILDNNDDQYKGIPIPSQFGWFTSGGRSLLLQDSNLDADFPHDAARAIQLYNVAGGSAIYRNEAGPITAKSFQGVIAITPWLIENMLKITGSISVPTSNGTTVKVDSTNLISEIHFYQLALDQGGPGNEIDPNKICNNQSYRKCFTGALFAAMLSKLGTVSTKNFGALGKLIINSLHTKDIQIFLTQPGAEALLLHHDLASAVNAPKSGDGMMVVDANVDGIKANNYLDYTWTDKISLDSSGNATHHLVLTYKFPNNFPTFTDAVNATFPSKAAYCGSQICYQDWLRVYIPSDSNPKDIVAPGNLDTLGSSTPTVTSSFGMTVIQGEVLLYLGTRMSFSYTWTVPHAAIQTGGGGWLYQYTIEKQAGITWPVNVELTLPSCAHIHGTLQGFTSPTAQTAVYKEQLATDTNLSLQYSC